MAHTFVLMGTNLVVIAVFFGLAIYVATHNPRQLISWVFSIFCLTIASTYLSSLFLPSEAEALTPMSVFLLRWQWVAVAFSPALYLHLLFFYFPRNWQPLRQGILLSAYLFSAGLALTVLFTDLVVSGPLPRHPPHITGPMPGPLMPLLATFSILAVLGSAIGLITNYRLASVRSMCYQITYLIVPTLLILIAAMTHWIIILTKDTGRIPHEIPDSLLLVAAFFYARAVVRFGSFVGRPLTPRSLFYTALAASGGLTAIYLTLTVDQWLMRQSRFPLPMATGILVLILAAGFPGISRWITKRFDHWLFRRDYQQRALIRHLAELLVESPDLDQSLSELLNTLGTLLDVPLGFAALATSDSSDGTLTISAVRGNPLWQPGERVSRPSLYGNEPQLAAALWPQLSAESPWTQIAMVCPLTLGQAVTAVVALGEKRDGTPFTPQDLALCDELTQQLDRLDRVMHLRLRHDDYLQAARLQKKNLRELGQTPIISSQQTSTVPAQQSASLQIRTLGILQVVRNGELVSETDWGSEKAKALLAYLLWKWPAGATREELAQALWPERPFDETANVFHVTLHRLRRVLQPEPGHNGTSNYVEHDRGYYRLAPEASYWLDLTTFKELITDPDDLEGLRAAVELYRGPYLADMAWVLPCDVEAEQRQMEQMYADALRLLASKTTAREAALYLEKLIAIEPADETAQQALVLGYLGRARRDLARQQVSRWREALADLDLEPSPEAQTLWQRVETRNGQAP